jgi:hypothetical protein
MEKNNGAAVESLIELKIVGRPEFWQSQSDMPKLGFLYGY